MSWQDRPYSGDDGAYNDSYGGGMGGSILGGMQKPPVAVKWLLVINFAVFLVQLLTGDFRGSGGFITSYFAAIGDQWWQLWRYVSFQFLHGGIWHIGLNMLGLYFMGSPLERRFGTRWFLSFYLTCGVAAGLMYVAMSMLWGNGMSPLVGASGGVYAIVLAAAVYFPHFRLIMLFFPVPIRLAAAMIFGVMVLTVISGFGGARSGEVWSQVAHFGGAAAGGIWLLLRHKRPVAAVTESINRGRWEKRMAEMRDTQRRADEILEKVHNKGINSLTASEKKILKKATEMQKQIDDRARNL